MWVYLLVQVGDDEYCYKSCLSRVPNFYEKGYPDVISVEYYLEVEKSS